MGAAVTPSTALVAPRVVADVAHVDVVVMLAVHVTALLRRPQNKSGERGSIM